MPNQTKTEVCSCGCGRTVYTPAVYKNGKWQVIPIAQEEFLRALGSGHGAIECREH